MREAIEGVYMKELNKPGAGHPGIALKSQRCILGCSTRSTAPSALLNKPQNTPWSILGWNLHGMLLVLPQCTARNIRLSIFGWAPRSIAPHSQRCRLQRILKHTAGMVLRGKLLLGYPCIPQRTQSNILPWLLQSIPADVPCGTPPCWWCHTAPRPLSCTGWHTPSRMKSCTPSCSHQSPHPRTPSQWAMDTRYRLIQYFHIFIRIYLFIDGSTMWRHHFLPFKVTPLGRSMVVGQCRDNDQDKIK